MPTTCISRSLEPRTAPPSRARWQLTTSALERLLASLSADDARAAAEYNVLRRRLLVYFDGRGCRDADVCADETLDRVARRLQQGECVENLRRYVFGVARHVASEAFRRAERERNANTEWWRAGRARGDYAADFTWLQETLRRLPSDTGSLLVEYYDRDRSSQDNRRRLADQLGISYGALKLRVHRARALLEAVLRSHARAPSSGAGRRGHRPRRRFRASS
jgi:DNA-directed RNA polymerase specialized sigma24 family protein